eukprot:m.231822 g.231822  ORF g.231822 m.231822 type:complete len:93 (+) comp15227_c0_seq4:979-1257(+)
MHSHKHNLIPCPHNQTHSMPCGAVAMKSTQLASHNNPAYEPSPVVPPPPTHTKVCPDMLAHVGAVATLIVAKSATERAFGSLNNTHVLGHIW